jgi:hypothetical protein
MENAKLVRSSLLEGMNGRHRVRGSRMGGVPEELKRSREADATRQQKSEVDSQRGSAGDNSNIRGKAGKSRVPTLPDPCGTQQPAPEENVH